MTLATALIRHDDTEITAIFARIVEEHFGGQVSILPNVAVLNSARRQSRRKPVELSVVADDPCLWTCYRIGQEVLLLDAASGGTIDLYDVANDEDERAAFAETHPALADVLAELNGM